MTNHSLCTNLKIEDLEFRVYLGWPDKERLKEQLVLINIDIFFETIPAACASDKLDDTFCYSHLIKTLHEKIGQRHFHLIENLCHELYKIVKEIVTVPSQIIISVTKHPNIPGLKGGVTFSCGDKAKN